MRTFLLGSFLALLISGCDQSKPDPVMVELEKAFNREGVLVKTCSPPAGSATANPISVYRFRGELWFHDHPNRSVLRRVEANLENVCEILQSLRGGSGTNVKASQ